MERPGDPALEVDDPREARVRCHRCDRSYIAHEMDRDPIAGHQAICAECATGRAFYRRRARGGQERSLIEQAGGAGPGNDGGRRDLRPQLRHGREPRRTGAWAPTRRSCRFITIANVACGFHGGDPVSMRQDGGARQASTGCAVGAHPGYPDLLGFGRRRMELDGRGAGGDDASTRPVRCRPSSRRRTCSCTHIKPHGAFFAFLRDEPSVAEAVARSIAAFGDVMLYWPAPAEGVAFCDAVLPRASRSSRRSTLTSRTRRTAGSSSSATSRRRTPGSPPRRCGSSSRTAP